MRALRSFLLLTMACGPAASTAGTTGTTATTTPAEVGATDEDAPEPESVEPPAPSAPSGPLPVLVWRGDEGPHSQLGTLALVDEGSPPIARAATPLAGALGQGSTSPVLSPDGRRVAYLDEHGWPATTTLATGEARTTWSEGACGPDELWPLLTAWSSDGGALLYHVAVGDCEDCTITEACEAQAGFYLWPNDGPPRKVELPPIDTASEAPGCFLGTDQRRIYEACVDGSRANIRGGLVSPGQIGLDGHLLTWLSQGTIMVGPLDHANGEDEPLVEGSHAENQWARVRSTGSVWQHRSPQGAAWVLFAPERTEIPFEGSGISRWHGEEHVLLQDDQGVRRVSLTDGEIEWLTRERVYLVTVGTPR